MKHGNARQSSGTHSCKQPASRASQRSERWTIIGMSEAHADNLSNVALSSLFAGGQAYSCGAYVNGHSTMRRGTDWFCSVRDCTGLLSPIWL